MHQPIRNVFINAILFVVLLQLGVSLQTWTGWQGFLATGVSMLPALAFGWFHLPEAQTGKRIPFGEAGLFYLSVLGIGFVIVDILQLRPDIWLCLAAGYCVSAVYKIGKSLVIRSDSTVGTSSKT